MDPLALPGRRAEHARMELGLQGKVALVAGAGRGLGRAVAEALAAEGARVALVARTADEVEAAARGIVERGGEAIGVAADLTDAAATDVALAEVTERLGPPAMLVWSVASWFAPRRLHTVDAADLRAFLDVDLVAAADLCRRLLPGMIQQQYGRVICLGSLAARTGVRGGTAYAAAKAGLAGLVRGIAADYGRYGITANLVTLGFVDTERLARRTATDASARQRLADACATRRIPTPAECAAPIVFLCSPVAGAITGADLDVTAGAHLNITV